MLDTISRTFFYKVAESEALQYLAHRYGLRNPGGFARRFVAGESVEEAIETAREIKRRGMMTTLDCLGENTHIPDEAAAATNAYLNIFSKACASGIDRNFSIKLTQLGLGIDRSVCLGNLRRILDSARDQQAFIRIDMEESRYTESTLEIFEEAWRMGYRNVGIVIQSYLYRSESDVREISRLGARIRLVKGAYNEPKTVAHQRKADVDAVFSRLMKLLLAEGNYPAIATHDERMIDEGIAFAERRGIPRRRFELQMLYGIRDDLQSRLVSSGFPLRIYLPFGRDWFPYFMRRLGERPANIHFVVRSLARSLVAASRA